jgi:hypothetical protein
MVMENSITLKTPQQAADFLGLAYQHNDPEVTTGRIKGRVNRGSGNADSYEIYGETKLDLHTG